ncbi:MAG TPA: TonB-dependent receptor [Phenylobacterium sp.]|nr:TonB-dependent receptor [Phenylobacterium sp.]
MKTLATASAAIVSLTALSLSAPARADDAPTDVGELVVVATRTPQPPERIGQQVSVIGAEEIKARQMVVVSDLLIQTPGVNVSRSGGVGAATSLRIRGAETDQTVVVIDGVKLNDPSGPGGGYNFGNLMAGDIARIEVLRGAQSTLWGSQAIGGVVNIATVEPTSAFEGSISLEGGSMKTAYARAGVGGRTDRLVWRLAAGDYVTDGVSAFRGGRERDGYRNIGLSGTAKVVLTDSAFLDFRAVYSRARNKFDGFPAPRFVYADDPEYGTTEDLVGYAGLNFDLFGGKLKNRIAYGYTDTDRDNFDPTQAVTHKTFEAVGTNRRWEYQGVLALPADWQVTFGAESERSAMRAAAPSDFDPSPVPSRAHVRIDSLYVQAIGRVTPGLTLTAGLRHDSHDTFGDQDLGQLAAAWSLNDGATILRASVGQGFKAPTLFQLYSEFGNTGLAPEEAVSWDAGIEHHLSAAGAVLSATWFQRETRNQIDFVSCAFNSPVPLCRVNGVGRFGFYDNIARARTHGVEVAAAARLGEVAVDANYTWTHAENDSAGSPNRGRLLALRPEHQASVQASYVWPVGLSTSAGVVYVGESFDNAANSGRLKAHTLVDLRASWPVGERIEVYGRVENALDETYETVRNNGAPGRGAYLGVRASF